MPAAFGRRARFQEQAQEARRWSRTPSAVPAFLGGAAQPVAEQGTSARSADPVDAELEEWKRTRKRLPLFAWRPLYLMASLCFGLASFVLPDSINEIVQWPLYALAAMSFYVGFKMKRTKHPA
ncbi:MAG: hypothetical protein JSR60_03815 [Proteobacteria bacterium]|nr:hypothetical protein [Pseudomonadota bacterium]